MFEAALAGTLLCYLLLLGMPGIAWQFWAGSLATALGLAGGGMAGVVYHLALYRELMRLHAETRGWLWSPVAHHEALDEPGKRRVLPWFRLGAAGFVVCIAGIGMVVVAVLRSAFAR
jgi:hypothetical protein